jgi:uncharacterized protein DUF3187
VRPLALALVVVLGPAARAGAQDLAAPAVARRGPIESRDQWLLSVPRAALPALGPDPLPAGETRLRLDLDWGSDFGYHEAFLDGRVDEQFLVDGEHRTLALEARRGISPTFGVGLRLPLQWQGGGVLDGLIDTFHRITGLPGGARPLFPRNLLRVEGRDDAFHRLRWTGRAGTGLGRPELFGSWSFARPAAPEERRWAAALVARAALPAGTGPFAGGGLGGGAQLVAARALASEWDLYLGLGVTADTGGDVRGIAYRALRPAGFLALEWRPLRAASLVVQLDGAGRLVTDLATYPGFTAYFRMAAKLDLSPRLRLEGGFTEGIRGLDAATDFGVLLALARRF